jgi:biotin transport system substrate-specific component
MQHTQTAQLVMTPGTVARRALAVVLGAALVAASAQFAIPLPGTPVPITLQVPAVLIVGGLLGPRLGALSMAVYLAFGAAGLPVFAPVGVPGAARLFGPTGGYLLTYPLAAALVGLVIQRGRSWAAIAGALVAGLAVIHLGGIAQLAILSNGWRAAVALGSAPFLLFDLAKILVAGVILRRFVAGTRALLL